MQVKSERRSNRDRTAATRAALTAAARRFFVAKSYGATGTPEIVAAAGVTRGALYHHFSDKRALFAAVAEAEAAAVAAGIERAAPQGRDPIEALIKGGEAFLDAMAEPGRTRLLLLDGPAVLGRGKIDEIDARHGGRTLREGLDEAMRAGAIRELPLETMAGLLGAAYDRAALMIDGGHDSGEVRAGLAALIRGLAGAR